jgi:hypothetical protein
VLVGGLVAAVGFNYKKGAIVAFGALILMLSGLLIMDVSPNAGIEKDYGTFVREVGDGNYNIDVNVGYLNAGNDNTLFILSNVLFYGGLSMLLGSFVVLVSGYRASKRGG